MSRQRPVNLDLRTIKFPITAITSILHRISGFIVFLCIPLLLWLLQTSLTSQVAFQNLQLCFENPIAKIITWLLLAALLYHLVAGIRHLLMDWVIGETLRGGKIGSVMVFVITALFVILLGVWLW